MVRGAKSVTTGQIMNNISSGVNQTMSISIFDDELVVFLKFFHDLHILGFIPFELKKILTVVKSVVTVPRL